MTPSNQAIDRRIRRCVSDLRSNGIDLTHADDRHVRQVVREHLDYFQLMLGYESDVSDVVALVKARRSAAH